MLQTKNLTKRYKPKKGVPVTALDSVSLKFPETGMVFLLGKSGSGKSTLLNLLGGLDTYDSGEIIIKGVSSKDFKQSHFDSYRNTYVGFIFQEYNVLDEFTVGANIALAIELQGRKAKDEEINKILNEVDLAGYGDRKPNELSGGQKQRVAIARALVKNPDIIMADEPTGALDSATGKQVFDTLKRLSQTKLVIVVSHDRDFAEQYADRIIELSDGKVIDDIEYTGEQRIEEESALDFAGPNIHIPKGYKLTEEDRAMINDYIAALDSDAKMEITNKKKTHAGARKTDESKITYKNSKPFELIKSRLPMRSAFKIGSSGLKHKKIRLVVTILLSCIAFGLFGLADTFGSYNHIKTCTNSIVDSKVSYLSVEKQRKYDSGIAEYYANYGFKLGGADLKEIEENTGVKVKGVYPSDNLLDLRESYDVNASFTESNFHIYAYALNGFAELSAEELDAFGYQLTYGAMPDGAKDEIAISEYVAETYKIGGFANGNGGYDKITSGADLIGRKLNFDGREYTVTGIIDTKTDIGRYRPLTEDPSGQTNADLLIKYALYNELASERDGSLCQVAIVGGGFIDRFTADHTASYALADGYIYFYDNNDRYIGVEKCIDFKDVDKSVITWTDGEKSVLSDKEIIIAPDSTYAEEYDMLSGTYTKMEYSYHDGDRGDESGYKVVGYIDTEKYPQYIDTLVANKAVFENVADMSGGIYSYAVGAMPGDAAKVKDIVTYCYSEGDYRYAMTNSVTYELDTVNGVLKVLSKVFLYVGIGFALFAALMLANFIGTSISYKKQEIGILRAIGSRSNDVFAIFFAESFIIAMINFVLSSIGVGVVTAFINHLLRTQAGILITVLNFGIRQIALLLAVSLAIAAISSFIPVKRIASKRPIDAIRGR